MTDDQFLQIELAAQCALHELKDACEENDEDFQDRAADLVYNAENKE